MDLDSFMHFWDWIDKADALRGNVLAFAMRKGGGHYIEFLPPVCGGDVEAVLRKYGVDMWGRGITRGNHEANDLSAHWCCCYVRKSQAVWARYLMTSHGCQLVGDMPKVPPVGMPRAWADREHAAVTRKTPAGPAASRVCKRAERDSRHWFDL